MFIYFSFLKKRKKKNKLICNLIKNYLKQKNGLKDYPYMDLFLIIVKKMMNRVKNYSLRFRPST